MEYHQTKNTNRNIKEKNQKSTEVNKQAIGNPHASIITLEINWQNSQIKRQRVANLIKKTQ